MTSRQNGVERISISLEPQQVAQLERLQREAGFSNRSEFVRSMIENAAVEQDWTHDHTMVLGTITMVYDHHRSDLCGRLVELQHNTRGHILASTHVHLNQDTCGEMLLMAGHVVCIRKLFNEIRKLKGMHHATVSMSAFT